jgi:hypothetical protein
VDARNDGYLVCDDHKILNLFLREFLRFPLLLVNEKFDKVVVRLGDGGHGGD